MAGKFVPFKKGSKPASADKESPPPKQDDGETKHQTPWHPRPKFKKKGK